MSQDFWLRLALAALIIVGVWTAFGKVMILGWLGDIWERRLPDAFNKPLWQCPPCMASVHGTWVWFLTGGSLDFWWIAFVLALSGAMKLIVENLLRE